MDIFRLTDGFYVCINNPENREKYILVEIEGAFPILRPVNAPAPDQNAHLFRQITPGQRREYPFLPIHIIKIDCSYFRNKIIGGFNSRTLAYQR